MDRDEVAIVLSLLVSGLIVWIVGAFLRPGNAINQTLAWRRVWLPALPASTALAVFVGWGLSDPEGSQGLHASRWLLLVPLTFVWVRATVRACRAAFGTPKGAAYATGILFPRVTVSDTFRSMLTEGELHAVLAHEQGHVVHRDPARVLLAQWITDLQWPLRAGEERRRAWLHAMELARDDEAIFERGADASDLASALVKAASLGCSPVEGAASFADNEALLEARVVRLLRGQRPPASSRSFLLHGTCFLILASLLFGAFAADPWVAWVAGSP